MVNLKIRFPYAVDGKKLAYKICEALQGNRGFIENDIVVNDDEADEKSILISLGDDADKNPGVFELALKLDDINGAGLVIPD